MTKEFKKFRRALRAELRSLFRLGPIWPGASSLPTPSAETARVVLCVSRTGGIGGPGKLDPDDFLPGFGAALADAGVRCHFEDRLSRAAPLFAPPAAAVLIYNEEPVHKDGGRGRRQFERWNLEGLARPPLVFNSPRTGRIIASKAATFDLFRCGGIPVPDTTPSPDAPMLSFDDTGSNRPITFIEPGGTPPAGRHNVRLVDTRVTFRERVFWTSLRLLCVGGELVFAWPRARDAAEGNPSVHSRDTPLCADLLTFLHAELVNRRMAELRRLARQIGDLLGPGFYAHDVLVEQPSGRLLVCESGFKFSASDHKAHVSRCRPSPPACLEPLMSGSYARVSAAAFLKEWRTRIPRSEPMAAQSA